MPSRIVQKSTAVGTALTASSTEGSLARWTIAANELTPGKVFDISGYAQATATNSTDTATMAVRFGTTSATPGSNTAIGTSAAVDAVNADMAGFRIVLDVETATRAVAYGWISDMDANSSKLLYTALAVLTIAADTVYYLDFTGKWSTTDAGNSMRSEAFTVIEIV